ncbi:MAG TPA: cobalt transporter CbiM [Actinomycetota bacterium]|nr:cobalt transporter CbiM [Actinomycetota bacterium]
MHIPDGYLSPETCAVGGAAMLPVFYRAGRGVRRVVKSRSVPLLAIGAAFCFLVMMFNVPIPDGTTAHAVGTVLVAVILGPEAAIIAVATALAIQALFFGDGGVLAYPVNAFNMAVVMTLVGYYLVYRPLSRGASLTSPRRAFAAALGGYLGISAAALCASVELGLQPVLFHTAGGSPLYSPYHLAQTIPAMMLAHLTVAGGVEFALTFGVIAYLQRANLPLLRLNHPDAAAGVPEEAFARRLRWRHALIPLGAMLALSPLGLLAPGGAFGEDNPHTAGFLAKAHLSALPSGLARYTGFWHHALFSGYDYSHAAHPTLGYLVSALAGVVAIGAAVAAGYGALRALRALRRREPRASIPASIPASLPVPRAASSTTPAWLLRGEVGLCPCGCIGTRSKGSFVEKTLRGASGVLRSALFGDEVAGRDGLLQRLDARVKLVTLLGLLVVAGLVHSTWVLLGLYALALGAAAASRISIGFFVKRVWLFIPVFTGVVVAPATLNIITKGHIVVPLGSWWFGHQIGVTAPGLQTAARIVARVAVSISLVVLLTLTTPWAKLMAALRALLVPPMFVQVIGMSYRYVFHLLGSVEDMYTARRSRTVGAESDVRAGRAFVAATGGALFGKAQSLSEEVYQAMVSRGYTGHTRTLQRSRLAAREWCWMGACLVTMAAVLGLDRALGR